jgi:imidazolonepropionase
VAKSKRNPPPEAPDDSETETLDLSGSGEPRPGRIDRMVVVHTSEICVPEASGGGVERMERSAIAIDGGVIRWIGPEATLPESYKDGAELFDAEGFAVVPALVDCHTHLVYAGDRVADFSRRTHGMTYAQIAQEGGGISTTVRATRSASSEELCELAQERLLLRRAHGIATTEIKSGYGLSIEHEIRMLEVIDQLRQAGFDIESTLLAAHTVPKEVPRDAYVQQIIEQMIPEVADRRLARFVDVFVEKGAYSVEEARRIFEAGKRSGLLPRIHADQLSPGGGAELAASVGAVSADHLENISEQGIDELARAHVVATLLPGALTYLGEEAHKLGRRLVDRGVEVAIATDENPGSSPTSNLPMMATIACTKMGLTVEEALRAITLGGAHALGRDDIGTLRPGAKAQLLLLEHKDSRALVASYGEPIICDTLGF